MNKVMHKTALSLLGIVFISGPLLSFTYVSAEDTDVIDTIELTVPIACTMGGVGTNSHNATISPGTYSGASGNEYEAGIGKTTLTSYCNDNNGFSIYAIGFTNDLYEGESHTKLVGNNTNQTISTKVYANGDTSSNWSMKLTKVDNPVSGDPVTYNPENMTLTNSFNTWHEVPDTYTKVAEYHSSTTDPSTTDTTLGAKLETTYATFIASDQVADTYTGQVKYTMVHPYDAETPKKIVTKNLELVFDADPLYFDEEKTQHQNIMKYSMTCSSQTRQPYGVFKTSNLDYEGEKTSPYGNNTLRYTYSYDEADKLLVTVRYGLMAETGWITISSFNGEEPYYISSLEEEDYPDGQNISGTESIVVNGNRATLDIRTYAPDNYLDGYDYGAYIVIRPLDENGDLLHYEELSDCDISLVEGTYKKPLASQYGFHSGVWRYKDYRFSYVQDVLNIITHYYSSDRVIVEAEIMR